MGQVIMNQERREFSRIGYRCPAILYVNGSSIPCQLLDISLRGARVRAASTFEAMVGNPGVLLVQLDAARATIRMSGVVAHHQSDVVGIACQGMDLDSAIYLRRLLEVNLAEDRLLDHELSALVQSHRI